MLLKEIRLTNFRQFIGTQSVTFSLDPDRNVTIVMGEIGTGKTTLAQAFTWCLYGETDFENKIVLNNTVGQELGPNNESTVVVELALIHMGREYLVTREQKYTTDSKGMLKRPNNTKLIISYKNDDGQREFIKDNETEIRMKEILPKELSRYFFFDGERIGNMGKEIQRGKSKEFAEAVKGLLGLNALSAALEHIGGRSTNTVLKNYVNDYDAQSDSKIAEYRDKINTYDERLEEIEKRLSEIDEEETIADDKAKEYEQKISENRESEQLAADRKRLLQKEKELQTSKINNTSSVLETFSKQATAWISTKMISDSLEELAAAEKLDTGIPDIHARTIEYLIKRGTCICGTPIEFGSDAYNELNKLLEYIPPKSIGTIIGQFARECELKNNLAASTFNDISNRYGMLREFETTYDDVENELANINQRLEGMLNVGELQKKYTFYKEESKKLKRERNALLEESGGIKTKRERCETESNELALKDDRNKKLAIYHAYATYIYQSIERTYKEEEKKTRDLLEKTINDIFKEIYDGGFSLKIDEKYNIEVVVDDMDSVTGDVETSQGQSISIIFAFISGVIKLARENAIADGEMLMTEAYPLVMDAPLSSFDKTRIKTVCEALPKVAEQVIIFIKDTDGELAEENMGEKVGAKYMFDKINEFETKLIRR